MSLQGDGGPVRIRWDGRARQLGELPPPGGGVYVIYNGNKPESVQMTSDFRRDIATRYGSKLASAGGAEMEMETEGEGEDEFGRRRWRRGRRRRWRRWARFGRIGRRFGRYGRGGFLRRLRQQLLQQGGVGGAPIEEPDEPQPPEADDDADV
jgi:hypothetical protein